MENILDELTETENSKRKEIIKHQAFLVSKNPCLSKFCHYIYYYYKMAKYNCNIIFNKKLFDLFSFFNPNFKRQNKVFVSPKKHQIYHVDAQNEEIKSDNQLKFDFDEEERNPGDFREIALYMKKNPQVILKEGTNIESFFEFKKNKNV